MAKRETIEPVEMWAEVSEDSPPQIWDVAHYRENLRDDLRHIRVIVKPIPRKKRPR